MEPEKICAIAGALLVLFTACGDSPAAIDASLGDSSLDALQTDATVDTSTPSGEPVFEYVSVDGAVCANGTPVGMGISPVEGAETLVVFINGGGACWDSNTCFVLNSASHISTTYTAETLEADIAPLLQSELVRRGSASPIADASFAFVPYCTADLHSGSVVRDVQMDLVGNTREVHHMGRRNMEAFVSDLASRFPSVNEVFVVGFSAGGFGAVINVDLFDAAFSQKVPVLSDGSPFIQPAAYGEWVRQWEMQLPAGCGDCPTQFGALLTHQVEGRRHGLITTTNDEVIRAYFDGPFADITARVEQLVQDHYNTGERHAWMISGTEHVLLGGYASRAHPAGASLQEWTNGFFGAGAFETVIP